MDQRSISSFRWLRSGEAAFDRMLQAINGACETVWLETYTFRESLLGTRFRDALTQACARGVEVTVVADFIGSRSLRTSFWDPLLQAGGKFRWFNPWNPWWVGVRNHRKILVCDDNIAFVGGFNIAPEYEGDGVHRGWRDLGLEIQGPLAKALAGCVADSYTRADFKHKRLQRLRRSPFNRMVSQENWTLLLSGPGRGRHHLKQKLAQDLTQGETIRIITAYFLPTWRIRRELLRASRRGAQVQLILPGKSDVALSLLAGRCLYRQFLRAGVKIYEYQPQVLHTKLAIIDDLVYVGSANLDPRSLNINYELLIRIQDPILRTQAQEIFSLDLTHCQQLQLANWNKTRPFWQRWFERWAYFILVRLDPFLSRLRVRDVP